MLRIEQDSYRYTHKILWPAGRWATAEWKRIQPKKMEEIQHRGLNARPRHPVTTHSPRLQQNGKKLTAQAVPPLPSGLWVRGAGYENWYLALSPRFRGATCFTSKAWMVKCPRPNRLLTRYPNLFRNIPSFLPHSDREVPRTQPSPTKTYSLIRRLLSVVCSENDASSAESWNSSILLMLVGEARRVVFFSSD